MCSSPRTGGFLARVTTGLYLWQALVAVALAAAPAILMLDAERLNRTYVDVVAEVEPIANGPLIVRLSSPANRLTLEHHSLELERLAAGAHRARAAVRFAGEGRLRAELELGGIPAGFESDVVFPSQLVEIEGEVAIERLADGYQVTTLALPAFVEVEMRSALVEELMTWCSRFSLFVAGADSCGELDQRLSHPRLPLPKAGETAFIAADELTAEERRLIDSYLSGS